MSDRTPTQIKMLLELITNQPGVSGGARSGGPRETFSFLNGPMIVNHLVPSSDGVRARNARGYILLNIIPELILNDRDNWPEFQHSCNKSIGIVHFTFKRLLELLNIIIQNN